MPKISVISACYNHGKYIHEMIDSVLNQTLQDFEIIIVNDGSTDDTREILDKIQHDRIRIFHSEHKGPSHARNLAISNAGADIVFNLDSDDRIADDLLEKGYNVFLGNENAGIVYTECRFFGARKGIMKLGSYSLENMLISNRIVSAAFFRKEDWHKCGGYSEEFTYGLEDWDLWLGIIELSQEVIKIPDSYFYYRVYRDLSESRSGFLYSDRSRAVQSILQVFKRHPGLYSRYPAISRSFSRYEKESVLKRKVISMVYPMKYKLSCILN